MTPAEEQRRLAWQCRRGMLELDELLLTFLEKRYESLEPGLKGAFRNLLMERDPDLFQWLLERPASTPPPYADLVTLIRKKGNRQE